MRPWNRRQLLAGAAAIGLVGSTSLAQAQSRNVIDTLAADGRFNRFLELVGRGGATDQFRGAGPITLFAPTDAAFNAANAAVLNDLLAQGSGGSGGGTLSGASPDFLRLRSLIGYHVIAGLALTSALLVGDQQIKTVSGAVLRIAAQGGTITLTNPAPERQAGVFGAGGLNLPAPAVIDGPDIIATNGVIHPITQILFP
ncbi:MAG: fasciclin domain-containing protein [Paracraurococcus sp.]